MLNTEVSTSDTKQKQSVQVLELYKRYAPMLFGYIFDVVKNREVAEDYLIAIFTDVPQKLNEFSAPGTNVFCQLRLMARQKLAGFFEVVKDGDCTAGRSSMITRSTNKFVAQMTAEQQLVFCGIYWNGKTINMLSAELNKPEEQVKRLLKECFTSIRNSGQ